VHGTNTITNNTFGEHIILLICNLTYSEMTNSIPACQK